MFNLNLDVTLAVLDLSPSIVICCSRCMSHASSHDEMFPFMPYDCRFFSRCLCGTVSKALLKSNMSISTCWLLSIFLAMSSVVMTSFDSQKRVTNSTLHERRKKLIFSNNILRRSPVMVDLHLLIRVSIKTHICIVYLHILRLYPIMLDQKY